MLAKEGDDFAGELLFVSPPEVIRSGHNDNATAFRQGDAERLDVSGGGDRIALAEEEQDRATRPDGGCLSFAQGRRDGGKRSELSMSGLEGNDGAEGVAGET